MIYILFMMHYYYVYGIWILIDYVSDITLLCHSVLHFMFCHFCISSFLCDSIYIFIFIFCS